MELNRLYDIANKENIGITNFKMQNKAIIGRINKKCYIGLNYSKIGTSMEEKELLAEELGHYYCNCFYNDNSPIFTINQKEYRANKWKCTALVTVNSIKDAMAKGCNTFYEISNELCVSEKTLRFAYNYYKENGMIFTNEEMLENSI